MKNIPTEAWYFIFAAVAFAAMFGGMAYSDHTRAQCSASYATSTRSADEIRKICE